MKTEIYNIEKKLILLQAKLDQDSYDCTEIDNIIEDIKTLTNNEKEVHRNILKHIIDEDIEMLLNFEDIKKIRFKNYLKKKNDVIDMLS